MEGETPEKMTNSGRITGRVLLVYPRTGIDVPGVSVFPPLSIWTVASALDGAGFEAILLDVRTAPSWRAELERVLEGGTLYVGISAMTGAQIASGLEVADLVRRVSPQTPIVWGGTHATILPQQTLDDPRVDAVVAGCGEAAAVDLAAAVARGETIAGRILESPIERTGVGPGVRVGRILERVDVEPYVSPVSRDVRGLALVTSRGCPHRCSYCYNQTANHSRWSGAEPESVLEDLERLYRIGQRGALFFDDNFFVNRKRVQAVAEGILARGWELVIKADCRADYVVRYDDEFLKLIRSAGFEMLYVGGESGSDRVLEMIRKDVSVETLLAANAKLARHGIRPHYSFMGGLPGETVDDMRATADVMVRLKREHPGCYLSPVKGYVPYPGTVLYETALASGFEAPANLEGWAGFHWNSCDRPWMSPAETRFLEKLSYVSSGLDPSIVELSGIDRSRFLMWGYNRFSRLCHRRVTKPDLGFVPELPLVRIVRNRYST